MCQKNETWPEWEEFCEKSHWFLSVVLGRLKAELYTCSNREIRMEAFLYVTLMRLDQQIT